MADKKVLTIGALIFIIMSGIFYVQFQDVKIRVDDDQTTFYRPNLDYPWIWSVTGRETNQLFDGSSLMNRDRSSIRVNYTYTNNSINITRYTKYIRGPVIIDEYYFEGDIDNKDLFPISHKVRVINASGYFYRYQVRDLIYNGSSEKLSVLNMAFGRDMEVEWESGYRWAWVYKAGILKVQYDIVSDDEVFDVRLFDPVDDWVINGSSVYINNSKAYISATPHTLSGNGWVYYKLLNKVQNITANLVVCVNKEDMQPKDIEYFSGWINVTIPPNATSNGSWYLVKNYTDFKKTINRVETDFDNMTHCFYITNINVNKDKMYDFRIWFNVSGSGKYDLGIYPSAYGSHIKAASAAGNLFLLDPWWATYGGQFYYKLSSLTDWFDGDYNATNHGSTSLNDYPSFNTSGSGSPNSSSFDGVNDYIDTNYQPLTTGSFSISLWFNVNQIDDVESIFRMSTNYCAMFIDNTDSNKLHFQTYDGDWDVVSSLNGVNTGVWNHVVVTHTGGGLNQMYVNNVYQGNISAGNLNQAFDLYLGYDDNSPSEFFNGKMDEVSIYNTSITSSQVSNLYNYGSVTVPKDLNVTLNSPADDATGVSVNPVLNVTVTGDGTLNVSFYQYVANTSLPQSDYGFENISYDYTRLDFFDWINDSQTVGYFTGGVNMNGEQNITYNLSDIIDDDIDFHQSYYGFIGATNVNWDWVYTVISVYNYSSTSFVNLYSLNESIDSPGGECSIEEFTINLTDDLKDNGNVRVMFYMREHDPNTGDGHLPVSPVNCDGKSVKSGAWLSNLKISTERGVLLYSENNVVSGAIVNYTWTGRDYDTTYYWYGVIVNGINTTTSAIWNFTTEVIVPNVTLNKPDNDSSFLWYNGNNVTLNFSVVFGTYDVDNCSLYGNFSGSWVLNQTDTSIVNDTITNFEVNNLSIGSYIWNVICTDNNSDIDWGNTNFTFSINNSLPTCTDLKYSANVTDYCESQNLNSSCIDLDGHTLTVYFRSNSSGSFKNYSTTDLGGGIYGYVINHSQTAGIFSYQFTPCDSYGCRVGSYDVFNVTQNVTTVILYLNGLSQDRKYELTYGSNLTGVVNSCTNETIYLSIDYPSYGTNYSNDTDSSVYYNFDLESIAINEFNDSTTFKYLSLYLINQTYVRVEKQAVITTAEVDIEGFNTSGSYPKDIKVDILNDSVIDAVLVGELRGTDLYQNNWYDGTTAENISFGIPGAEVRYINYSANIKSDTSTGTAVYHNFSNITMTLSGYAVDPVGVYFNELFYNDSYLNVTTCQAPTWIWDDFTTGEIADRWDGEGEQIAACNEVCPWDESDGYDVDVVNDYIYTEGEALSQGGCYYPCVCGDHNAWCTNQGIFWDEVVNINDYNAIELSVNLHTYAGGGGSCMGSSGGTAACYAGIKDRDTDEFFSVFPGAYAHESGSWGDSDYETDNEVSIINVYNHGTYYDIYDDDVYYGTLNGINSSHEYGYYVKCYNHGYSACSNGYGRGESKGRIDWINISGMKGAGDIDTFGNCSTTWNMLLNSTTTNLTRAYVDLDFVQPANTAYTIELSPDGGSNWESTTDKTVHYFINQGNVLMLRINLTSADTSTSVRIDDLIVQVVPGFASGIGIDVGYDGSIEWNRTAKLNSSNGPINITFEQIGVAQYIGDNCPNANTCLVPIAFKVDTSGNIGVSNMNFTEVFDILYLDKSVIQANVSDASKNIMLHFTSSQNGSINLTSLDIEYSGNDDVNISSNFYGNENYSAASDWQLMSWRYSPFTATWPTGISSYDVYPLSVDSKQVSPWGQLIKSTEASSVAMWNITTTALTAPIKVYRWIPTMDACLTLFVCDYSNLTSCTTITSDNSTTIITNLNNTESQKIYDFWNLTACNPVNLYLPGDHKFRGICQDCVEVW